MKQSEIFELNKLDDRVLDLIYDSSHDKMTTSDLQGVVETIIRDAYFLGKNSVISNSK